MRINTNRNCKLLSYLFLGYMAGCFCIASIVYLFLKKTGLTMDGDGIVFAGFYRMFMYHEAYPYQYILLVSFVYAIFASLWAFFFGSQTGLKRILASASVMVLAVVFSSIPGGVLWVIHDTVNGYFPRWHQFWHNIREGAVTGLFLGWRLILASVPFNWICFLIGLPATGYYERKIRFWTSGYALNLKKPATEATGSN